MALDSTAERPRRWERWSLAALVTAAVVFSGIVELRSAYLSRRMGDIGVFLRAGWAVRTGNNIYDAICDNGWHYHYPPLFAILIAPLADPPRGADTAGMVPFAVSVAVFYVLSLIWLVMAVHCLASALEETVPRPRAPPGSRRWLYLRAFPIWVVLLPVGHSLSRGQVTTLWMLIIASTIAGVLRGRRLTAGMWLAAAICLKIIPGYLLIYPLWRRDSRLLAGSAIGLFLGLGAIPAVAIGPTATVQAYRNLAAVLIGPALGVSDDQSRTRELIGVAATNNVSFQAAIYNTVYGAGENNGELCPPWVRRAHWLLGAALTLFTLHAAGWRKPTDPFANALFLGALSQLNLLISPVCHTLYFCLAAAPLATLVALQWRDNDAAGRPTGFAGLPIAKNMAWLALILFVCNAVPLIPALEEFRNLGVPTYAMLLLWFVACTKMRQLRQKDIASPAISIARPAA